MRYMKEILKNNRNWVIIYLIIGLFNAFLSNYKADYFQRIVDGLTGGTIVIYEIFFFFYYFTRLFIYAWFLLQHEHIWHLVYGLPHLHSRFHRHTAVDRRFSDSVNRLHFLQFFAGKTVSGHTESCNQPGKHRQYAEAYYTR